MNRGLLSLSLLFLFAAGCATKAHLTSIPLDDADFVMQEEELRAKFADIARYDGPYAKGIFSTIFVMPPMDELLQAWGEPASKRPSGWNALHVVVGAGVFADPVFSPGWMIGGAVLLGTAHPMGVWTWEKGNYEIDCVVDYPIAFKYRPHLSYWRRHARTRPEPPLPSKAGRDHL